MRLVHSTDLNILSWKYEALYYPIKLNKAMHIE